MSNRKYVAYYRVSTAKQGRSGLGLEAQREAVERYLHDGRWRMIGEFKEIESGKRKDRPALAYALALCRLHDATLIIAKLDRLARNVLFTATLMESGVKFTAVDFPDANNLTIHILAAVAEHEAAMISTRTKAALAAAKARGKVLGCGIYRIAKHATTRSLRKRGETGGTGRKAQRRLAACNRPHTSVWRYIPARHCGQAQRGGGSNSATRSEVARQLGPQGAYGWRVTERLQRCTKLHLLQCVQSAFA
jgi:DNA invertase Pin-like site-specific DNA recombinase